MRRRETKRTRATQASAAVAAAEVEAAQRSAPACRVAVVAAVPAAEVPEWGALAAEGRNAYETAFWIYTQERESLMKRYLTAPVVLLFLAAVITGQESSTGKANGSVTTNTPAIVVSAITPNSTPIELARAALAA